MGLQKEILTPTLIISFRYKDKKKKFKYVYMIKKPNAVLKFEIVILRQTNYRKNNK